MTNALFRRITTEFYYSLPDEQRQQPNLQFNCSNAFIQMFRERTHFSRRRTHTKRRPEPDENEILQFQRCVRQIFNTVPPDHIVNCDETFWKPVNVSLYTWASTNSDGITIDPRENEKKGFTSLAVIRSDGGKLPLLHIASGSSLRCEANWFGPGRHVQCQGPNQPIPNPLQHQRGFCTAATILQNSKTDHSPKGWTDQTVWDHLLELVRINIPLLDHTELQDPRNKIYLFADAYPVHHSDASKAHAAQLNIELVKIPGGTTDQFQPLDCRIFGQLKTHARSYFNAKVSDYIMNHIEEIEATEEGQIPRLSAEFPETSYKETSALLDILWENLNTSQIIDAWKTAFLDNYVQHNPNFENLNLQNLNPEILNPENAEEWGEDEEEDNSD